jgi:hypothetical protein
MPFDEQIGNARIEDNGSEIRIYLELPEHKIPDMVQFSRIDSRNNNSSALSYNTEYENVPITTDPEPEYRLYEMGILFNTASRMYLRFGRDVSNFNSPNSTNTSGHAFVELGIAESIYHIESNENFLLTRRTVLVEIVNTLLEKYNEEFETQAGGKRRRTHHTRRHKKDGKRRHHTVRRH